MKKYEMITLERAVFIPLETLVHDYNDAIETIWYLQQKLQEQMTETLMPPKTSKGYCLF